MATSGRGNPVIQRLQLRTELRKARNDAGLTQRGVAHEMEWSPSKLLRIEAGEVGISTNDLRALMTLYNISDHAAAARLLDLARGSRKMPFVEYRDIYGQDFLDFLAMESSAVVTRSFQSVAIPGLLQTEEYAAEIIRAFTPRRFSGEQRQRMLEGRMLRQETLERDDAEFYFVLDEAVLRRQVGGPGVMRAQLRRLAQLAAHPRRQIMILPFSCGTLASEGPFTLFEIDDGTQRFVYHESIRGTANISTADNDFDHFLGTFWEFEEQAIAGDDVPRILLRIAEHIETEPHDLRASVEGREGSTAGP